MIKEISTDKYYFDKVAAERVVEFLEIFCVHTKGKWSGKPFILEKWQKKDIIYPLFGWKRKSDNLRKYRNVYIELPRKNGKTTLASALAIYLLCADGEGGAEVFSVAADRNQAHICFDIAKNMVRLNDDLKSRLETFRTSIVYQEKLSSYKVLSSDSTMAHGLNSSAILFDELHAQKNRDLWDVMTSSTGARQQPIIISMTTAGYDKNSICYEIHDYAKRILNGEIKDDTFLPVIYAAGENDEWDKKETWYKANPNLGITIEESFFESEVKKAKVSVSRENTFRRLYLNQWTQQEFRWFSMIEWDKCNLNTFSENDLLGRECWAGLDLSSTKDLTAFVLVFKKDDIYIAKPYFWIPEEKAYSKNERDGVDYLQWQKDGHINFIKGTVVDHDILRRDINLIGEKYNIQEIAVDRWNASQLINELNKDGFTTFPFGQGFRSMTNPSKLLEKLILSHKLDHGNHPVLRWNANNVMAETDAAECIKPSKSKSKERIDGIVALIMALDRAEKNEIKEESFYAGGRGLF